jgi:hydrogenase nickel incorporation protein HypB
MTEVRLIEVKEDILSDNKINADAIRRRLKSEKTMLLNLMSSPGAGKTTLLMKSIEKIKEDINVGVIEADIDSNQPRRVKGWTSGRLG